MKRIVTIQDISCVGKCSLTVALPIISAMGVETAIIPTAVLSTHTMFQDFTCKDLTDEILPITAHWKKENLGFDAIYTGYLASFEQIDLVAKVFDDFKTEENVIVVDPVMADNGKLYPAFDLDFAKKMSELCGKADIIVPNITEAAIMTGSEYKEVYDETYVKDLLVKLSKLGAKISVLTGVSFKEGTTGVMGYDRTTEEFYYYSNERLDASFHGTGDVFTSTLVGAMMNGFDWRKSLEIAADYTALCIKYTLEDPKGCWYGVNFEQAIPNLISMLQK